MKHPFVAMGLVGALLGVTSLGMNSYKCYIPHFGRNMDDYHYYLAEHGALPSPQELRFLQGYNCEQPYTTEVLDTHGRRQLLEYTTSQFVLTLPTGENKYVQYTGTKDGSGERDATCTRDKKGLLCKPSRVFASLCTISFLQGDNAFMEYTVDSEKQKAFAVGLKDFYHLLQNKEMCSH